MKAPFKKIFATTALAATLAVGGAFALIGCSSESNTEDGDSFYLVENADYSWKNADGTTGESKAVYSYDDHGNLIGNTAGEVHETYGDHDEYGMPSLISNGSTTLTLDVTSYDDEGRPLEVDVINKRVICTVSYERNEDGTTRSRTVTLPESDTFIQHNLDDQGRLTSIVLSDGTTITADHEAGIIVNSSPIEGTFTSTYELDEHGYMTKVTTNGFTPSATGTITYDEAGRATKIDNTYEDGMTDSTTQTWTAVKELSPAAQAKQKSEMGLGKYLEVGFDYHFDNLVKSQGPTKGWIQLVLDELPF